MTDSDQPSFTWKSIASHPCMTYAELTLLQEQERTNDLLEKLITAVDTLIMATVNIDRMKRHQEPL